MALITTYDTLQDELKDELDRSDDTASPWTRFIQNAEERLNRDRRVRSRVSTTLAASAETAALPTAFVELVSLVHDGSNYYSPIEIVSPAALPRIKALTTTETGVPVAAAITNNSTIQFAPVPDQTYTLDLVYYQGLPALSATRQTNWLLDDHSDIYLLASVVEAADYFKDAEKLALSNQQLEERLERLNQHRNRQEWGGVKNRPFSPIG